jgi:ubiquinone/menaquinone biosynthesis C-methylase UbiE
LSTLFNLEKKYGLLESWIYESIISPGTFPIKVDVLLSALTHLPEGSKVLDLGCGGGKLVQQLANCRKDLYFVAIDNSADQIENAKLNLKGYENQVSIIEASALTLPFPDEKFDFVYSLASIKHWYPMSLGLSEMSRVLKFGGKMLITELDKESTLDQVREFIKAWKLPKFLQPFVAGLYYSKIIKHSLNCETVLQDLRQLNLSNFESSKFPGAPAFLIRARKI